MKWQTKGKSNQVSSEKGTNRKIFSYQCKLCKSIFKNHKNASKHVSNCKGPGNATPKSQMTIVEMFQNQPPNAEKNKEQPIDVEKIGDSIIDENTFTPFIVTLMNLVAECDIPYTSLVKPAWQEFLQVLCPSIQIPCVATLKSILLQELKWKLCGLAVDAATFRKKHLLSLILMSADKMRLLKLKKK